jgi:hypothetical protein
MNFISALAYEREIKINFRGKIESTEKRTRKCFSPRTPNENINKASEDYLGDESLVAESSFLLFTVGGSQ